MAAVQETGASLHAAGRTRRAGQRRWSLYTQVVTVNTAILLGATVLLVLSPATVSFPLLAEQGLVLGFGVTVIALANAVLLRLSFSGLSRLYRRMENLDVLRTGERLPASGGTETRALIAGYNAMLDGLEAERRASTRRSMSTLEGERRRIGKELHDEIGQRLTGILLQLSRARDDAGPHVDNHLCSIQGEVRSTLDEVGRLAWQLRPGILDDLGLLRAVEALADTLRGPATARIVLSLPARTPPMSDEVELALYRVAQEALTNAVRHADASTVTLTLRSDAGLVTLEVTDDGRGLLEGTAEGAGIRGMRERALLIRGRLDLDTRCADGLRVRLQVGDLQQLAEP